MRRLRWLLAAMLLVGCVSMASAHYLWVAINIHPRNAEHIDVTFEEGPRLGDGFYLDPFVKRGKTWVRSPENPKPMPIEMREMKLDDKKKGKRWLTGTLPIQGECGIDSFGTFGVYRYGKTDVLLHYNARHLRVNSTKSLASLARAGDHLTVDIVPSIEGDKVKAQVLWKGEPAAQRTVRIRGGGISRNLKTDDEGTIEFTPIKQGLYTLHTYYQLQDKEGTGTYEGKDHVQIRHHCTLSMRLPLADQKSE